MSKLEALRMQIRALEGHNLEPGSSGGRLLPFEDGRLNAALPHGGLQLGALHEICSDGLEAEFSPAATAFAATLAARILRLREGYALWAMNRADCYALGLARFGLDARRIVWTECRKDAEVLGVMEEALHSRALAAVLGEAGTLNLKTARRLDAAARQSGVTALLLRRALFKAPKAGLLPSGAAATRWCVRAAADFKPHSSGTAISIGPPFWRLDLEYCRNGKTASWIVEALDDSDSDGIQAGHVRVVAELCDDAGTGEKATARAPKRTARAS